MTPEPSLSAIEPVPSRESLPFWRAAASGRLSLPRCRCRPLLLYPPPVRCPNCLADELEWVVLSGRVRLRSWTQIHVDAVPGVVPAAAIAEVEPIEQPGLTLLAMDKEGSVRDLALGTELALSFSPLGNGFGRAELSLASQAPAGSLDHDGQ